MEGKENVAYDASTDDIGVSVISNSVNIYIIST